MPRCSVDIAGNDLGATGHAAVYGIYFDTDKADVKPESDAALQEIAKLLGQDAALKVMVVGHTDGTGDLARNMQLSEERARAVVAGPGFPGEGALHLPAC